MFIFDFASIFRAHDSCVILGLIAFRIWRTQRQTRDAKMGANLSHVSVIVIESGASKTFSFFLARCGLCPHAFVFTNRCHLPHRIGVQRGRLCAQIQLVQHLPGYGEYSPLTPFPSLITADLFLRTDFSHNRKHFCLKTVINPVSHRSLLPRALARPSPSLTLSGHRRT